MLLKPLKNTVMLLHVQINTYFVYLIVVNYILKAILTKNSPDNLFLRLTVRTK